MAKFFTSAKDLLRWIKESNSSFEEASTKLLTAVGSNKFEQDIVETTKRIFSNNNVENAADVLFGLLSNFNITEKEMTVAGASYDKMVVAKALGENFNITEKETSAMVKQAQIMRQPGEYTMPLRVCPKLPYSVGKRLISTYNCRHYCLDSLVFDDDPERVYCAEALWRQHVADKFSRDWKDAKTGQLVGGYINNRFYVFPDAGTPSNPDVPRDGGNKMELNPWERSRQPRKHEWSTERRLQEQREPGTTKSITLGDVVAANKNKITITAENKKSGDCIEEIFSKSIDMHNNGISSEDIIVKLSGEYNKSIESVMAIHEVAMKKMASHQADAYKVAQVFQQTNTKFYAFPEGISAKVNKGGVISEEDMSGMPFRPHAMLPNEIANQEAYKNLDVFDVYDPKNLNERAMPVAQAMVEKGTITNLNALPSFEEIQSGVKDVGLDENISKPQSPVSQESPVSPETTAGENATASK